MLTYFDKTIILVTAYRECLY